MRGHSRSLLHLGGLAVIAAGLSLMVSSPFAESGGTEAPVRIQAETDRMRLAAASERQQRAELSRRIQATVERSRKVIAGLSAQAALVRDPNRRVELDRRLEQAKLDLQIELLRVQAQFARDNGRVAQARDLEVQIAAALQPRTANAAASPAPTSGTTASPANGGAR